jgi:hypothetical protein
MRSIVVQWDLFANSALKIGLFFNVSLTRAIIRKALVSAISRLGEGFSGSKSICLCPDPPRDGECKRRYTVVYTKKSFIFAPAFKKNAFQLIH